MSKVSIYIPQIGEGLQEARVVGFLKQPGETVKRDEPIYQMETDKAVMDVESPVDGVLVSWSGAPDDVLAIGAEIAVFEVIEASLEATSEVVAVQIPQIGEGLQEARVVAFLKQPGDHIKRDDPIYQMETDKAVMDVESPYEGVLVEWLCQVDEVMAIGADIARMKISSDSQVIAPVAHGTVATTASAPIAPVATGGGVQGIPPRTRAYAKEKGLTEEVLLTLRAVGSKLMPADVDSYLNGSAKTASSLGYSERTLGGKQRVLNSRMVRSNALVVPGTLSVVASWSQIEAERARLKAGGGDFQPSAFTMFAFAVVKAMSEFPAFRSSLVGDDKVKTYDNVSVGIAVALPGDELVLAVVDKADTYDWPGFAAKTREQIEKARAGQDQAHEAVTVSLTNMQSFGLREAVPVVVAPSMATIFLGEVFNGLPATGELKIERQVNITMTFDHRLANGVGAADFVNRIKTLVQEFSA
jgi:pyruvate/2-oxoglutarate dehydrogenase complex dihydrolipoamide acyltransferase (E2) component